MPNRELIADLLTDSVDIVVFANEDEARAWSEGDDELAAPYAAVRPSTVPSLSSR